MDREWNDGQPIYRQLRDRVVAMILEGVLNEGDPLPSVRTVAAENRVNPLTVLKGYQELTDEDLVEKRRGLGLFVKTGARAAAPGRAPEVPGGAVAAGLRHHPAAGPERGGAAGARRNAFTPGQKRGGALTPCPA